MQFRTIMHFKSYWTKIAHLYYHIQVQCILMTNVSDLGILWKITGKSTHTNAHTLSQCENTCACSCSRRVMLAYVQIHTCKLTHFGKGEWAICVADCCMHVDFSSPTCVQELFRHTIIIQKHYCTK